MAESNTSTHHIGEQKRPEQPPKEKNPYLGSVANAPYTLGYLLRRMPPARTPLTAETSLMAKAAEQHSESCTTTLVYGLGVIGGLMQAAGVSDEYEMPPGDLAVLGDLIQHISSEIQFLREVESSLSDDLRYRDHHLTKEAA